MRNIFAFWNRGATAERTASPGALTEAQPEALAAALAEADRLTFGKTPAPAAPRKPLTREEAEPLVDDCLEAMARSMGFTGPIEGFDHVSADGQTRFSTNGEPAINPRRAIPTVRPVARCQAFILKICPGQTAGQGIPVDQMRRNAEVSDALYRDIQNHVIDGEHVQQVIDHDGIGVVDTYGPKGELVSSQREAAKMVLMGRLREAKKKWRASLRANDEFFLAIARNVQAALGAAMVKRLEREIKEAAETSTPWSPSAYLVTIDAAIQDLNYQTEDLKKGNSYDDARGFCWGLPALLMKNS